MLKIIKGFKTLSPSVCSLVASYFEDVNSRVGQAKKRHLFVAFAVVQLNR